MLCKPPLTFCENRCEYDLLSHLQTKYFSARISAIMLCKPPLTYCKNRCDYDPLPYLQTKYLSARIGAIMLCNNPPPLHIAKIYAIMTPSLSSKQNISVQESVLLCFVTTPAPSLQSN